MTRLLIWVLIFAAAAAAQVTPVVVSDTLRVPVGGEMFRGVVRITPPNVVCGGASYKPIPIAVQVSAGLFSVSLIPNDSCTPAGTVYQVEFQGQGGERWREVWRIPVSATPITLADVYLFTGGPGGVGGPVSWADILEKPETFPPVGHTHDDRYPQLLGSYANPAWLTALAWSKLTGVPATFPADPHSHAISGVTGLQAALDAKEASIAAGASNQFLRGDKQFATVPWGDVSGKPPTFPPDTHTHGADAIQTGVLPVERGGTGRGVWTAGRCVQVAADGQTLEPAAAECGVGGGGVAPSTFVKEFPEASTTWTITAAEHGIGSCNFDIVTQTATATGVRIVYGDNGDCQTQAGAGQYDVTVQWAVAQAGRLLLPTGTSGSSSGAVEPNLWIPLSEVTTIDVVDNWDTKALVFAVFDTSDKFVEADSFQHLSANSRRLTFEQPQTGNLALNRSGWSGTVEGGSGTDTTTVSNSGAGAQVLKTGTNVTARTIVGGVGISVSQNADTIVFDATGGGGGLSTVETADGILGDGSLADPVRVDPALVPMFLKVAATVNDWGTIAAGACPTQTYAFPGALSGDSVAGARPAGLPASLIVEYYVAGIDQMTVKICNFTGAGIAVANGFQFGATILRSF